MSDSISVDSNLPISAMEIPIIPNHDTIISVSSDVNISSPVVSLTQEFDDVIVMEVLARVKRDINQVLCPTRFLSDWHVKRAKLQFAAENKKKYQLSFHAKKVAKVLKTGGRYENRKKFNKFNTPKSFPSEWVTSGYRKRQLD